MPYPDRNRDIPIVRGNIAVTTATGTEILPAPGANKCYLFRVFFSNGGATGSANYVQSSTTTTIHFRAFVAATGGGTGCSPWLVSDTNNAVSFVTGSGSTTQYCCVEAYIIGAT